MSFEHMNGMFAFCITLQILNGFHCKITSNVIFTKTTVADESSNYERCMNRFIVHFVNCKLMLVFHTINNGK